MATLNTFFQQFFNQGLGSVSFEKYGTILPHTGYYIVKNVPLKKVDSETTQITVLLDKVWFISLNTMACLYRNSGLFEAWDDAGGQLLWLETQLYLARNETAQVIIAGNVSPGHKMCNRQWSYRYNVLIEAFQDVVVLQIFGYSHVDGF